MTFALYDVYLPILRCRERIETQLLLEHRLGKTYLPILRCRERIETYNAQRWSVRGARISLYFGVGSGLKPRCSCVHLSCSVISLYFGVGSGLKPYPLARSSDFGGDLPILRCRERIETDNTEEEMVNTGISLYFGVGSGLKQ